MLLLALALIGLLPGTATAWYVHHRGHGWPLVITAGAGLTIGIPAALLTTLLLYPPTGLAIAVTAGVAALNAYDRGRVWAGTLWASLAVAASACVGVSW